MKIVITDLQCALTVQLEAMHDAEELIQSDLTILSQRIANPRLKTLVKGYAKSSRNKRLKLKRMFSYVLRGPFFIKGHPVKEVIRSLADLSKRSTPEENDLLLACKLLSTAHYKISTYQSALEMSAFLALEEVSDMLNEIIALESTFIAEIEIMVGHLCDREAHIEE